MNEWEISSEDNTDLNVLYTGANTKKLVDPFTLTWLGATLAEGAIAALGGMIFKKIFETNAGGGGVDIQELFMKQLKYINTIIREAITAEALRQCESQIVRINTTMTEYTNAPASSIDRLISATEAADNLWANCKLLNHRAILPFIVVSLMKVVILQERQKRCEDLGGCNEPGEGPSIYQLCHQSIDHYNNAFQMFDDWIYSRFSEVYKHEVGWYTYKFDDHVAGIWKTEQEAHEDFELQSTRLWNVCNSSMNGSAYGMTKDLEEIMKKYEGLIH